MYLLMHARACVRVLRSSIRCTRLARVRGRRR